MVVLSEVWDSAVLVFDDTSSMERGIEGSIVQAREWVFWKQSELSLEGLSECTYVHSVTPFTGSW